MIHLVLHCHFTASWVCTAITQSISKLSGVSGRWTIALIHVSSQSYRVLSYDVLLSGLLVNIACLLVSEGYKVTKATPKQILTNRVAVFIEGSIFL